MQHLPSSYLRQSGILREPVIHRGQREKQPWTRLQSSRGVRSRPRRWPSSPSGGRPPSVPSELRSPKERGGWWKEVVGRSGGVPVIAGQGLRAGAYVAFSPPREALGGPWEPGSPGHTSTGSLPPRWRSWGSITHVEDFLPTGVPIPSVAPGCCRFSFTFFFKLASLPRGGLLSSRPAVSSSGAHS